MRLLEVLHPDHVIVPLQSDTLRGAVLALVERLVKTGSIVRPERLEKLVADERIRDVVHIGDRVLLPHLRTDAVDRLTVAIGIAAQPLRLGPSTDQRGSEQIVVLVLAPLEAANHYLQIVAALARALRTDGMIDRLIAARTPEEILEIPELHELTVQPRLVVRDIMTPRVHRVMPDTEVGELLELMTRYQLKAVPVVGEKREVLGVVTDRDILRHLMPAIGRAAGGDRSPSEDRPLYRTPVREIMSRSVMCISEEQGLTEAVSTMINKDVERLPVVHEGRLTGFVSRTDILRKLFEV